MTTHFDEHAEFARRISQPLRAAERVDETFEGRVMAGLRAAAFRDGSSEPAGAASWWTRRRTVRIAPVAALAWAAGIAALFVGASFVRGGGWFERSPSPVSVASSRSDTVHVVRFVFVDSNAREVELVGTFNQWQKGATAMRRAAVPGVWTVDVPLTDGRHEYAFVVHDSAGERWVADPLAMAIRDEFGAETSVLSLRPTPTS